MESEIGGKKQQHKLDYGFFFLHTRATTTTNIKLKIQQQQQNIYIFKLTLKIVILHATKAKLIITFCSIRKTLKPSNSIIVACVRTQTHTHINKYRYKNI